jgi:predicted lipid-binding transport protein (Tim44 family)
VTQLIIFAALAGLVLYQLYAVLGRRIGRQPEESLTGPAIVETSSTADPALDDLSEDGVKLSGLAAVRARDSHFDLAHFVDNARDAYETIVKGFAAGDRAALTPLLAPTVLSSFEGPMADREAAGRTEAVEFLQRPRADLERAEVRDDVARLTVRFLAEYRSRTKGPEGEGVDDRRTAELWTFERVLTAQDPNWLLVHVGAAEA